LKINNNKIHPTQRFLIIDIYFIKAKECNRFILKLDELGIPSEKFIDKIYLEASVSEEDTGIEAIATSTVYVTYNSMEIQIIEPNYYKPGFPIDFKVIF
jgi:hypothetical protein